MLIICHQDKITKWICNIAAWHIFTIMWKQLVLNSKSTVNVSNIQPILRIWSLLKTSPQMPLWVHKPIFQCGNWNLLVYSLWWCETPLLQPACSRSSSKLQQTCFPVLFQVQNGSVSQDNTSSVNTSKAISRVHSAHFMNVEHLSPPVGCYIHHGHLFLLIRGR